jgi:hypothetical protein
MMMIPAVKWPSKGGSVDVEWLDRGILIGILLLAFIARMIGLGARSFWYDEGYTVMFASRDLVELISGAARLEMNTPLHYVILHGWMMGAGSTELVTRLVSVFADMLVVSLAYHLARYMAGKKQALYCAAVVALWPVSVSVSQEARMYSVAICLNMLSLVMAVKIIKRPRGRDWILWAVFSIAAFSAHVLSACMWFAQMIVLIVHGWKSYSTRSAMIWSSVITACVIGVWVFYLLSMSNEYGTTYAARLMFFDVIWMSLASTVLPRMMPADLIPVASVLVVLTLLIGYRISNGRYRVVSSIALLYLLGISAVCSLTGKFAGRYASIVAPLVAVCVSLLVWDVAINLPGRLRKMGVVAGALVIGVCASGVFAWHTMPAYANDDYRDASSHISANIKADEAVLLVSGHFAPVFQYYYQNSDWYAIPADEVLNVNHVLDYASAVPAMNQALVGKSGAWLLLWQSDIIDPTGIVQALLLRFSRDLGPDQVIDDFSGLRLIHYRFFAPYEEMPAEMPALQSRVETTDRERGLEGMGCRPMRAAYTDDRLVEVFCFWRLKPGAALPADTKVSLRLFDARGEQVAQTDTILAPPLGLPYYPFYKPITSVYHIALARPLKEGRYELQALPYTSVEQVSPIVTTEINILPRR